MCNFKTVFNKFRIYQFAKKVFLYNWIVNIFFFYSENKLSTIQINKIRGVINKFSEDNINGFKKILFDLIEADNKKTFQQIND